MVKKHFKLYKRGKQWVSTAIVALASLTLGMAIATVDAQADTVDQNATVATSQVVEQPAATTTEMKTAATVNTNSNEEQQPTQSGLVQRDGGTYYYNKDTNNYVTNSWENVNNNWYHFGDNGAATTGWYQSGAKNWYMFNNDGSAKTGWFKSDAGNWYYFDQNNAWADTGWQKINNNWYHFDENNAWASKGWYQSGAGNWYHFDENNAWADTGWQKINNTWYYFDMQNAWMLSGTHNINGKSYTFSSNGAWIDDHRAAVDKAMSMRGKAYVWGGNNPSTGFDCSGLVQWAYGLGSQYRTTYQQQTLGVHHHDVANAPKGSLLFFGSDSAPYHVAISLGNGAYVHAPEPGDVVKVGYNKYFNASYYVTL